MNYTYIVTCSDGTLYTGWTNNIAERLRHNPDDFHTSPAHNRKNRMTWGIILLFSFTALFTYKIAAMY